MKNLFYSLFVIILSLNAWSQNVSVIDEQTSCDGEAILDPNSIVAANGYSWYACSSNDSLVQTFIDSNIDTISNLCPGLYTLMYFDSIPSDTLYYYFTINAANSCNNFAVTATVVNESSTGACDGYITTTVTGNSGSVDYYWSNGSSSPVLQGLCAGTYTLTVTDSTILCSSTITVLVDTDSTACSNFFVTATATNESYPGACDGYVVATVSGNNGNVDYYWNNGSTSSVIQGLCAGTYTVNAIDSSIMCSNSYTVIVGSDSTNGCNNFFVTATVTNETTPGACDGLVTATVSGNSGNVDYYWNNGSSTSTIQGLCAGAYTLTAIDSSINCSNTITVIVETDSTNDCSNFVVTATAVNESTPGACDGYIVATVSGNNGVIDYYWSNGSTSSVIQGLCAGTYTVTAIDSSINCAASYTVVIGSNSNAPLWGIASSTMESQTGACDGSVTVTANGGTPPYSYFHSTGDIGANVTGLCAGIYYVVITDANADSLYITYIITSPMSTYNAISNLDSTITDTLFGTPIELCTVDYTTIDSGYVSNVMLYGADSILITWSIVDANGITNVTQMYALPANSGVYAFLLDIYCPQKALGEVYRFMDDVFINTQAVSLIENAIDNLDCYPNPFEDQVNLRIKDNLPVDYFILDNTGRLIVSGTIKEKESKLNLSDLSKGVYFMQLTDGNIIQLIKR